MTIPAQEGRGQKAAVRHCRQFRIAMDVKRFYSNPAIHRRMGEYLDAGHYTMPTNLSCSAESFRPAPAARLRRHLAEGLDISRSLWDRNALVVHLDIEYVNFDFPAEPYIDPGRAFALQAPVTEATEEILADLGIAPLHLLTGRGHHFVWRLPLDTAAFGQLKTIGRLPRHLRQYYAKPLPPDGDVVAPSLGTAFAGLSLVMEYLGHRIREAARKQSRVPVMLAEVEVPPQERGREMVVVDLSEYGDPLNTRIIRMPFSSYRKPWYKRVPFAQGVPIPELVVIPLHEMDVSQGIAVRSCPQRAADLAKRTVTRIPDGADGTALLIDAYRASKLAAFHDAFYGTDHDPSEAWPRTYDRLDPDTLPFGLQQILAAPRDRLLQPGTIRQLVRALIVRDWHPRHIAGLIRSKYERDHGWGREWYVYDAATRADFYVRLFSGDLHLGMDREGEQAVR